jgi:hypothetical protein
VTYLLARRCVPVIPRALPALLALLASVSATAQEPPRSAAHCATREGGVDTARACEQLDAVLPVAITLRTDSATIALTRDDLETVFLDALARVYPDAVRADSAWAFARRDSTHVWADVLPLSERRLRVELLYWRRQPDRTLAKLCHVRRTLEAPRGSVPALAAMLAIEAQELGRCALAEEARVDPTRLEPPAPQPIRVLEVVLIPLALAALASVVMLWLYLRRRLPDFWQVVARYPDKAYGWFESHDEWLIVDPEAGRVSAPDEDEFEGPFLLWVPKLGGRRVAVYCRRVAMQESERAFLKIHGFDQDGLIRG